MEDQIVERNIDITFDSKSSPDFSFEKPGIELSLVKQDFDFYLQKHPEIEFIFKSTFINSGGVVALTQEEYDNLPTKNLSIYAIFSEGELDKVYLGETLILQKGENGFFPYTFPIIF